MTKTGPHLPFGHLLPQAGEVKNNSPLPLAGEDGAKHQVRDV